ncbi:polysaccharide deacetylase family protein [bacterium]|nr:polysaccharide deacetylase family protein [bacterium]
MTPLPFAVNLENFVRFLFARDINPTFPVTAITVHRHPNLFRRLQDQGVEFAIHGYRHIDYTQLTPTEMESHLERAIQIFKDNHIDYHGFRFPFLRRTPECVMRLSKYDFIWDSSEVVSWPLPENIPLTDLRRNDYQQILNTYQVRESRNTFSYPWKNSGLIEIPVSVPDDDILSERLGLNAHWIAKAWIQILQKTHKRGDLFVLQLHPERFAMCRSALAGLLNSAMKMNNVWIAALHEIAQWWKTRIATTCEVIASSSGQWMVHGSELTDSRIQLGLCYFENHQQTWKVLQALPARVKAKDKPVIGIDPPIRKEMIDFLKQEGYLFEEARNDQMYAVKIKGDYCFEKAKNECIRKIQSSSKPLLKLALWPDFYQSALSITGDIDGVDIWDYWMRFYGT